MNADQLMIPVYINEKIVLDMLAIIEDGFSMVSQVNYTEHKEDSASQKAKAEVSTSATILSKLLKIDLEGKVEHSNGSEKKENTTKEKVHTNVSLLSKFRTFLVDEHILKTGFDVANVKYGDFIEIEGELEKNPLISYMDAFTNLFQMADVFSKNPQLGEKKQVNAQKQQASNAVKQIKSFSDILKNSGVVDFVLSTTTGTDAVGSVVLFAQEQYITKDNSSEILFGHFKVLGKVIDIVEDENGSIDLLRKTSLSFLSADMQQKLISELKGTDTKEFELPELKIKVNGPAMVVIPVAIYA